MAGMEQSRRDGSRWVASDKKEREGSESIMKSSRPAIQGRVKDSRRAGHGRAGAN